MEHAANDICSVEKMEINLFPTADMFSCTNQSKGTPMPNTPHGDVLQHEVNLAFILTLQNRRSTMNEILDQRIGHHIQIADFNND